VVGLLAAETCPRYAQFGQRDGGRRLEFAVDLRDSALGDKEGLFGRG
jgi:hypothetical protein